MKKSSPEIDQRRAAVSKATLNFHVGLFSLRNTETTFEPEQRGVFNLLHAEKSPDG